MPTEILYPNAVASSSNVAAVGDATIDACIDDTKGAYDGNATYARWNIHGAQIQTWVCDVDDFVGPAAVISNVEHEARGDRIHVGAVIPGCYVYIAAVEHLGLGFTLVGYNTKNDSNVINPQTGVDWTKADLDAIQLRGRRGIDGAFEGRCTAQNLEVTFVKPAGGFAYFVAQWLPPLLGLASHGVLIEELRPFFRRRMKQQRLLKVIPCFDYEFKELIWELVKRPKVFGPGPLAPCRVSHRGVMPLASPGAP